jgi:hypothetical protein
MPSQRLTADQIRKNLAAAKSKPATPAKGRTIGQNVKQSLDRVRRVPDAGGTGLINQ